MTRNKCSTLLHSHCTGSYTEVVVAPLLPWSTHAGNSNRVAVQVTAGIFQMDSAVTSA